jgi:taurine dioxygenase
MSDATLLDRPATAAAPAAFDIRPITPLLGAEIEGLDLSRPLDAPTIAALEKAIVDWKVLVFRDQPLTDDQHVAFARQFGRLTPAHPYAEGLPGRPEIWQRHAEDYAPRHRPDNAIPSPRPPRDYRGWHIDISFVANPNRLSALRGVVVPPVGGDTLWSDLEAAYAALSPEIKAGIDNLKAVHGGGAYERSERADGKAYVALHPLVRVHPLTGRKSLFVSPGGTSHIVGLNERENAALLNLLKAEVTRDEYQVRVRWEPDTLALWDNQNTAHAGPIDYAHFTAPRVVRRVTVAGEPPQGPDGFRSRPLVGELFAALD